MGGIGDSLGFPFTTQHNPQLYLSSTPIFYRGSIGTKLPCIVKSVPMTDTGIILENDSRMILYFVFICQLYCIHCPYKWHVLLY